MSKSVMRLVRISRLKSLDSWDQPSVLGVAVAIGLLLSSVMFQEQGSLTASLRSDSMMFAEGRDARGQIAVLSEPTIASLPEASAGSEILGEALTVAELESQFDALNYDLAAVQRYGKPVPRTLTQNIPGDLGDITVVERRKALFFRMVLPLVLVENERLGAKRARIKVLQARMKGGSSLSREEALWIRGQFTAYKVGEEEYEALLARVDVIPPSLAMAQAAIESGWGTSRFAREGNALFGQWVWGEEAHGIVPEERNKGLTHKIRAFRTPLEAVQAYIKNLNTHYAYQGFREIRAKMRRQGAGMNGMMLAEGLEAYSEKGRDYINLVRTVISVNGLRPLDRAVLQARRV